MKDFLDEEPVWFTTDNDDTSFTEDEMDNFVSVFSELYPNYFTE